MICAPCRTAGFMNAELTRHSHTDLTVLELMEAADKAHAQCKGGTWCDCHHFIGQAPDPRQANG